MDGNNTPLRQIIAIGGNIAKSPSATSRLFAYGFSVCRNPQRPRVLLVDTASGDGEKVSLFTHRILVNLSCTVTELTFFARTPLPEKMRQMVMEADVILVNGGNTRSMLAVWREYGLPKLLREAWESGVVMMGSSAGALCWFKQCVTDSFEEKLTSHNCLDFIPLSCCAHFDDAEGHRETYHRMLKSGELANGVALDELVMIHFIGDLIHKVVSPFPRSSAYECRVLDGEVVQTGLPTHYIAEAVV